MADVVLKFGKTGFVDARGKTPHEVNCQNGRQDHITINIDELQMSWLNSEGQSQGSVLRVDPGDEIELTSSVHDKAKLDAFKRFLTNNNSQYKRPQQGVFAGQTWVHFGSFKAAALGRGDFPISINKYPGTGHFIISTQ